MDEPNQKPTDEMLKEARRLAFFADEVLSQDILNSYEDTENYIKRHAKTLIEQGTIKPEIEYYAYAPEDIKKVDNQNTSKIFLFFNSNIFLSLLAILISYLFYLSVSSYLNDLYQYYICESVFSLGSNLKECYEKFSGLSVEDRSEYSEKFKIATNGLTILKGAIVFIFIFIFILFHFILNKLKEGFRK